ncbi:hypothetical protein, partial [Limnospira sp. Paracas R14]|uniref:hypothetical protein n=1 Tax=Limnospira sp. Paracas R14 TaxID=2981108 RepID=UPI0028E161A9|nr:hypothetical protein [Limnospira sp. Paracas R14]
LAITHGHNHHTEKLKRSPPKSLNLYKRFSSTPTVSFSVLTPNLTSVVPSSPVPQTASFLTMEPS